MIFATYRSGPIVAMALNCTDLRRGDFDTLMDGSETVADGVSSIHFAAGVDPGGAVGQSFYVQGCAAGTAWTIQGSNGPCVADVPASPTSAVTAFNATFQDLNGSSTTGNGIYTEQTGTSLWYRFRITTLGSGDHPVVIVRRS